MKTQKSKTVFIEYSTAEKGQHFMTVMQNEQGKRQIIGRVFREYDKENKKMNYTAKDWAGNEIFADTKDLYAIKKKFTENGKLMAQKIPTWTTHKEEEEVVKHFPESEERTNEVKEIRERKTSKDKEQEIGR